ncbi:hypothetical protein [Burkholderia diffusa]|uniref:hypothetical protein n=1 Tax=Burkholderia diffusa TaxID=488732 RepID=UPI0012D85E95|nr:hypothetical protein [Burkholderia diffusa]
MARRRRSRSALLLSRIDRDRRRVDPRSVVNVFLLAVELQGHPQLDTHPGPRSCRTSFFSIPFSASKRRACIVANVRRMWRRRAIFNPELTSRLIQVLRVMQATKCRDETFVLIAQSFAREIAADKNRPLISCQLKIGDCFRCGRTTVAVLDRILSFRGGYVGKPCAARKRGAVEIPETKFL